MSDNEEQLYDEFGNYIGPDLDDDDDDDDSSDESSVGGAEPLEEAAPSRHDDNDNIDNTMDSDQQQQQQQQQQQAIVLHEDKEHYESATQVFGHDVKTAVLDEDAMDLETPILESASAGKSEANNMQLPDTTATEYVYSDEYLGVHMANETCRTRRGVAIVGQLHHGKTSLVDLLLQPTLQQLPKQQQQQQQNANSSSTTTTASAAVAVERFTDTLKTEQDREMSLVTTPLTCLLSDTRGKSYCITLLDTPGHVNFHDQVCAALRAVDGAVLVVDVVEGVRMHTEMVVRQAISEGLPFTLVLSKMDRLMTELKLPPRDAYYKLQQILDELNGLIGRVSRGRYPPLDPARGNVAFASASHGWIFTLQSFAQVYLEHQEELGANLSVDDFSKRLWGDSYLDPATKTFQKSTRDCSTPHVQRTFVTYVLEPLYKIYTACLGEANCAQLLRKVGVLLNKEQLRSSAGPLLRHAMQQFLQTAHGGFCEMLVQHVPHPKAAARAKIARCYTGPQDSKLADALRACDPNGPLVVHVVQHVAFAPGDWTLARIYSGTVRPQTPVHVLGENYSPDDDTEDVASATIQGVAIPRGRKQTRCSLVKAGNWVLLEGVEVSSKTATLVSKLTDETYIFAPLSFPQAGGQAIVKVSLEPLQPAELPKMVQGLRKVSKTYPMAQIKVEESGEHVVMGTGELYMDCILHDLRKSADMEVKVADPLVAFRETVVETSSLKCFAETANKRNQLSFIAEPLDEGLAEQLEAGKVRTDWDTKKMGRFFQTKYNWDLLSSRSVWAFGDSATHGTNILLDDTLPSEVDKTLLNTCRSSIVQGFQWATREGPLCEEPVRGTKIKLLDVTLADKAIYRGGGQMIPAARRTVHSSLLTATPRLMEPIYRLEIQCPVAIVDAIQPVLARRRGHIVQDRPIPGTLFASLKGFLPVLDSFGFETDLRTFTQGQAMVFSVFDHWSVVPGDPLDRSIILHPLEPSPPQHLARELLVKTRRRKGLSEDVSVSKFFDEAMKEQLAAQEAGSDMDE